MSSTGMHKADLTYLERLVDKHGVDEVLSALSRICGLKSVRIAVDYQDAPLARRWAELESVINVIVTKANSL
jgi:hypothetical protein